MNKKPVILTGLRANSDLHIGNYLGALLPLIDMAKRRADEYQINLFIPDLHSFTTPIDHSKLYNQILQNVRVYLAAGLPYDHPDVHVYRQSYVPAHSEMTWILDCFTGMGEMNRMTQFKDKSAKLHEDRINIGLFHYPVLMAADILLYDAKYVPVGDDQTQHLEYTRDIAQRMNNQFGQLFTIPEPVQKQHEFFGKDQGLRIKDLLDPTKKMSKSDETGRGVIFLSDTPEAAAKKIMGAATDSFGEIRYDMKERPGISNLLQILALLSGRELDEIVAQYQGQSSYGELKKGVAQVVQDFLAEFQVKLAKTDEAIALAKLEEGEAAMREQTSRTLTKVQRAVGLRPKRAAAETKRAGSFAKPVRLDFSDYAKLDIRIGTIREATIVDGSDKLIQLDVDFGDESRTVVTGMREFRDPASLKGKQLPFVANLSPRSYKGAESRGMLMAVETSTGPVLLLPEKPVNPGSAIE